LLFFRQQETTVFFNIFLLNTSFKDKNCRDDYGLTVFFMDGKRITKLTVQKNDQERINIFLDDTFAFGLSRIIGERLRIGQVLTQPEIDKLLSEDLDETIRKRALSYLSRRARSENELRKELLKNGYEEKRIDNTIAELRNSHLLNDEAFSNDWVENRNSLHPRSQRLIALELRHKGITEEIIQESLKNADDDQTAYDLGSRYSRRLAGLKWPDFRKRLSNHLAGKGYDYGVITRVVRQIWNENEHSAEDSLS
jgi:regulatory protein